MATLGLIRYCWGLFKILYINLGYLTFGLPEDQFYIWKANIWASMGYYQRAIKNYDKVLRDYEDSNVRVAVGWCYGSLGLKQQAPENYRKAYETNKRPDIAVGLAFAEYVAGNLSESQTLVAQLRESKKDLDPRLLEDIDHLQRAISENSAGFYGA